MRRVALKIAYIGTNFHGYQRQPNYRTVEGELLKVFKETHIIEDTWEAHYSVAGRTDKGVHSTGNVISFMTDEDIYINQINGLLPDDIKIIGEARVRYGFKVRFPLTRTYTYVQPFNSFKGELNLEKIRKTMTYFVGEHNFRNFSKRNEKNPNREIYSINLETTDDLMIFTIVGKSFLWNMVRKMITALFEVGYGNLKPESIKEMLQEKELRQYIRLKPAPANGLILSDMDYKDIKFKEYPYAKNKLIEFLKEEILRNEQEKQANIKLIKILQNNEDE